MIKKLSDIFLFNPTCEYAIANGNTSWQPNRLLQKMESDLSCLPLFFATNKDYVVVDRMPSNNYLGKIKTIKPDLPNFILKNDLKKCTFQDIGINRLIPWGWSPAAHKLLFPLKSHCSNDFKASPIFNWTENHKEIYSKRFSLKILHQLTDTLKLDYIIPDHQLPRICHSKKEVEKLIQKWNKIMVKAPWSSSGRGLQPVTKIPVHEKVWEKINGIIHEQGFVIVEPLLEKVLDFSFQFEIKNKKPEFLGISNFCTDKKGQYQGNNLNGLPDNTSERIREFQQIVIADIWPVLIKILEKSELIELYEGYFGVDTLVYSNNSSELKINPCLEINVRQSMGLLSLQLEKLMVKNKKAIFRIYYEQGKTFKTFTDDMKGKHPLIISNHKIKSGFFTLTEALDDTLFGAYILVE